MEVCKKKLGWIASLVLFVSFLGMSRGVYFESTWLAQLDHYGNELFRLDLSSEMTDWIFSFTQIGSIRNLILLALVIGALLLYNNKKHSFFWFGITMMIAGGLTPLILKQVFGRQRPVDGLFTRTGYSFPSGHTMGTLALYGLIIMLAMTYIKRTWMRYTVMIVAFSIILIVSWSRIHLGVHYFSDVLGSLFLGVSLLNGARLVRDRLDDEGCSKKRLVKD